MPRTLLLILLLFSFLRASVVHASEVVRPDPKIEADAAQVLWNLNLKLRKAKPRHPLMPNEIDPYPFRRVALSLARLGRVETALSVVEWKPLPDMSYARNEVLRLAVRRSAALGNFEQAKSLIPQMDNHYAKADAFLTLARAYLQEQDYPAAQKVLFEVTPQVPDNYQVLLYTAVLFAQSQNAAVSQRLFERAKGMILSEEEFKKSKSTEPGLTPFNQREQFGYSLLQAGFIDQWLQYRTSGDDQLSFPSDDEISLLLERGNAGTLLEVIHHMKLSKFNVGFMIIVSQRVASQYPDQALAILDKASTFWLKQDQETQANIKSADEPQQEYLSFVLLTPIKYVFAQAYAKLGKKETSEEWTQRITKLQQQDAREFGEFYYRLLPIIVSSEDKSTFPPGQLSQINNAIQPYLPALENKYKTIGFQRHLITSLIKELIKMQITAGQTKDARNNIRFLDTYLRKSGMAKADLFPKAIEIAQLWKSIGDQQQCDALLEYALDTPEKTEGGIKLFQISTLARSGYINVARRRFNSMSPSERKDPQADGIKTELMTQEAIADPGQFLSEQLKSDTSQKATSEDLYSEVNILFSFIEDITSNLYPSQNEPQHMLDSDGTVNFRY